MTKKGWKMRKQKWKESIDDLSSFKAPGVGNDWLGESTVEVLAGRSCNDAVVRARAECQVKEGCEDAGKYCIPEPTAAEVAKAAEVRCRGASPNVPYSQRCRPEGLSKFTKDEQIREELVKLHLSTQQGTHCPWLCTSYYEAAAGGAAIPVEPPVAPKSVRKVVKKEVVESKAYYTFGIMTVEVPEGMAPGTLFKVQAPNGVIQLQVPAGVAPGQVFHVVQAPSYSVPGTVFLAQTPNGPVRMQVPAGGGPGQVFTLDNAAMIAGTHRVQAQTPNGPVQMQVPAGGGPGQVFTLDNAAMIAGTHPEQP